MRKGKEDVFRQFRESFGKMEGHFHILEQRVPVEMQMTYFKYSESLRNDPQVAIPVYDEEIEELFAQLILEETPTEEKKRIIAMLAISRSIKAYRLLEEYTQHPNAEVADWSYMAFMELRISLEQELSDEKQIYISTGLGGKDEKLRFFIIIFSRNRKHFEEYQRQVVEREFAYYVPKANCVLERLTIEDEYAELLILIPVKADIKGIIDLIIQECNQYGNFLSDTFTLTNVKELSREDILAIIEKDGDSKASN